MCGFGSRSWLLSYAWFSGAPGHSLSFSVIFSLFYFFGSNYRFTKSYRHSRECPQVLTQLLLRLISYITTILLSKLRNYHWYNTIIQTADFISPTFPLRFLFSYRISSGDHFPFGCPVSGFLFICDNFLIVFPCFLENLSVVFVKCFSSWIYLMFSRYLTRLWIWGKNCIEVKCLFLQVLNIRAYMISTWLITGILTLIS